MGLYNTYSGVQLKVGKLELNEYQIGDKVNIPNGAYIGAYGLVIIKSGCLDYVTERIFNTYGDEVSFRKLIQVDNPFYETLKIFKESTEPKEEE